MKALYEILSAAWSQALGWTLIHSLWQSAIVFLIVFCLFRFIGNKQSAIRYVVALIALAAICIISTATFLYLKSELDVTAHTHGGVVYQFNAYQYAVNEKLKTTDTDISAIVQSNMPLLIVVWLSGAIIFSLRMAGGWWYTSTLRSESSPLDSGWTNKLNALAYTFGVKQWVEIASSVSIHSPVVFGYFKPIILVPASMLTGLTPEQIETIFLHELAHIKRNDYIVNLVQSFIESVYFFNPFVWIVSSWIRTEREHCCDDMVVAFNGNALGYARALTKLEEVRTENPKLALALSGNSNNLLARIKRIMERSARKYPTRERIIPVVLLIAGLTCASWLTIQGPEENQIESGENEVSPAKKAVITLPADSIPTWKFRKDNTEEDASETNENRDEYKVSEEFEYEFEFDDETFTFPEPAFGHSLNMNVPFNLNLQITPDVFSNHPFIMQFNLDSIPGHPHIWNYEDQEAFNKEFQEKFSHFYETHQKELEKMMSDLDKKFQHEFNNEFWQHHVEDKMKEIDMTLQAHPGFFKDSAFWKLKELEAMNWQHLNMAEIEEEIMDAQRSIHEKQMEMMPRAEAFPHDAFEERPKITEKDINNFRTALKKQLVKDGYLNGNEEITSMQWNISDYDCTILINGKLIKETDVKKYRNLHDQYFKKGAPKIKSE